MNSIVILFAGDSGDGIQLLGNLFTSQVATQQHDFHTFSDFPAEIRAPAGTTHGVSGFKIKWGNEPINTSGDLADIFIAFNAAAFKKYHKAIKATGLILYDPNGFDAKNCKLAGLDIADFDACPIVKKEISFSKLTIEGLSTFDISIKDKNKNKNFFALGVLSVAFQNPLQSIEHLIVKKFGNRGSDYTPTLQAYRLGANYADTIELILDKFDATTHESGFEPGEYRNINGNQAIALAILAAPFVFDRKVLFAGYPITPASDILHELSKYAFEEIICKQAEDEIAAIGMALGASFAGNIGITATSGPGLDLKQETIGLAVSAEMPLLIIDVQRAGPSTGMPTKVEQSDLNTALYGRHGVCPVPIVAIQSVATAFDTTLQAIEIMIRFQTPVILLSDVLLANGSEPWKLPQLNKISIFNDNSLGAFTRNKDGVRPWTTIGEAGKQYIVGGLEKDIDTGQISYDPTNHQRMTDIRNNKIQRIAPFVGLPKFEIRV